MNLPITADLPGAASDVTSDLKVEAIPIRWSPDLPIYACEAFLKYSGNEYGWLGGFDDNGEIRCVLPYTIIEKGFLRMARFRVETLFEGHPISPSQPVSGLPYSLSLCVGGYQTSAARRGHPRASTPGCPPASRERGARSCLSRRNCH